MAISCKWIKISLLTACIGCIFLSNSCNHAKNGSDGMKYSLVKTDSLTLEIDSSTKIKTNYLFYFNENEESYITFFDAYNNSIHFYNAHSGKKAFSIKLEKEGPNSISHMSGYKIKTLDSIYVFTAVYEIYLINRTGDILSTIRYDTLMGNQPIVSAISSSRYHTEAILLENNIYAMQIDGAFHYLDEKNPTSYNFCYKIDLNDHTIQLLPIHHPNNFWSEQVRELFCSWDHNGRYFVFAPIYSHSVYISRNSIKIDSIIDIKSKYVDDLLYFNPNRIPSSDEAFSSRIEKQAYSGLYFDPYRNVYYRLFKPGIKIDRSLNGNDLFKAYSQPPTFGIMVLDSTFNILYETILPENIYSQYLCFVGENGLYLSANHPDNPHINEDEWEFQIYNLIESE